MFNILWSKESLEATRMQSKPNICDGHIGIIEIHVRILKAKTCFKYPLQSFCTHVLHAALQCSFFNNQKFKIHNFII